MNTFTSNRHLDLFVFNDVDGVHEQGRFWIIIQSPDRTQIDFSLELDIKWGTIHFKRIRDKGTKLFRRMIPKYLWTSNQ